MTFTAKDVQTLREMTGAGMMDCKKALTEADGSMDKAVELLREKGLAAAAKKAGRIASEGIVLSKVENSVGVIIEVNSETDFVSKNEDFVKFVNGLADTVLVSNPADVPALLECPYAGSSLSVAAMLQEKVLTIGENIQIRRFCVYDSGESVAYVHMGGKIGVLINMEVSDHLKSNGAVEALGRDLAMQIAAMRPSWLSQADVDAETIAKEKEILVNQAVNDGKPQQIAEKVAEGRMNKFFSENCLLSQPFVKNDEIKVSEYVDNVAKELSGAIKIIKFTRFEKGEGLEKREDNFADEVAGLTK